MSKLYNPNKANMKIAFAGGTTVFDAEGYAEVADDMAKRLSELPGYSFVDEGGNVAIETKTNESNPIQGEDQPVSDTEGTSNKEENDEDTFEASAELSKRLKKMNVAQLKKYARENNIELHGATKKDPIISIIMGASND